MGLITLLLIITSVIGLIIMAILFYKGVIAMAWLHWVLSMAIIFLICYVLYKLHQYILNNGEGW